MTKETMTSRAHIGTKPVESLSRTELGRELRNLSRAQDRLYLKGITPGPFGTATADQRKFLRNSTARIREIHKEIARRDRETELRRRGIIR